MPDSPRPPWPPPEPPREPLPPGPSPVALSYPGEPPGAPRPSTFSDALSAMMTPPLTSRSSERPTIAARASIFNARSARGTAISTTELLAIVKLARVLPRTSPRITVKRWPRTSSALFNPNTSAEPSVNTTVLVPPLPGAVSGASTSPVVIETLAPISRLAPPPTRIRLSSSSSATAPPNASLAFVADRSEAPLTGCAPLLITAINDASPPRTNTVPAGASPTKAAWAPASTRASPDGRRTPANGIERARWRPPVAVKVPPNAPKTSSDAAVATWSLW
mmetsp:Transcript_92069/g.263175  ORF Transcript_92069/g.263175 Transcript_92069/m.263175 type:complete len:278 (-) Transcript_92069:194-1027(-)